MRLHDRWPAGIPRPRDYFEAADGLCFAVVSSSVEDGHAFTSLRYVRQDGALVKLTTDEANAFLQQHRPSYLAHSTLIDTMIHRVPLADVVRVHRPDERLATLAGEGAGDGVEDRALRAVAALAAHGADADRIGLGGSLLLGAQHPASDIDLVVYGRRAFAAARRALAAATATGRLQPLGMDQWEAAWSRRGSDLTLGEYVRAEGRKLNKAVIDGTRLDLTLVVDHDEEVAERGPFRKLGRIGVTAEVTDASTAFDHPARYRVRHPEVTEVIAFTPTYAGQAEAGEMIEARGWLEEDPAGTRRLVVGTSREARGEYIKRATTD